MTLYGPAYTFSPDAPADDPRVSQIVSNLGRPADGQFDSSINSLNYCEIFFWGPIVRCEIGFHCLQEAISTFCDDRQILCNPFAILIF